MLCGILLSQFSFTHDIIGMCQKRIRCTRFVKLSILACHLVIGALTVNTLIIPRSLMKRSAQCILSFYRLVHLYRFLSHVHLFK